MIRILALSDIHSEITAVNLMREQEENNFDAICVAGDIGPRFVDDIFNILTTFSCPVYYIYGNIEHNFDFDREFPNGCIMLHHRVLENNGYYFTGFNGCTQGWGKNPIRKQLYNRVDSRFPDLIRVINSIHKVRDDIYLKANQEYKIALKKLNKKHSNKRSKGYEKGVLSLGKNRYNEYQKFQATDSRIEMDHLKETQQYKKYATLTCQATEEFIIQNRTKMFKAIQRTDVPSHRLIIMTHERQYRMHEELEGIKCHLFGHHHGFRHTLYKGTNFVNVSALDPERSRTYQDYNRAIKGPADHNALNLSDIKYWLGTYSIIELSDEEVTVSMRSVPYENT